MKKSVPKIGNLDLKQLSKDVFPLEKSYLDIIKCLTVENNPNGTYLSTITAFTQKSNSPIKNHKTVLKKLNGTNRQLGLIPSDYVIEKKLDKKRSGNNERVYFLTFKGLMTSLATGLSIKKSYLFRNIVDQIMINFKEPKIKKIVEEVILNDIKFFILLNSVRGIQLLKIVDTDDYFIKNFQRKKFWDDIEYLIIRSKDENTKKLLSSFHDYYRTIEILFSYWMSNHSYPEEKQMNIISKKYDYDKLEKIIFYWPYIVDKFHNPNFDLMDLIGKREYNPYGELDYHDEERIRNANEKLKNNIKRYVKYFF